MLAITVKQPRAQLLALGIKAIETRPFQPRQLEPGEWIAIHAGLTLPPDDDSSVWIDGAVVAELRRRGPDAGTFALGAVIGVAQFWAVERADVLALAPGDPRAYLYKRLRYEGWPVPLSKMERGSGDFTEGRKGWLMSKAIMLPSPVACRGKQGLWPVPLDVVAKIREQVGV